MSFFKKTKEYLVGVSAEAKRVTWPGKSELWESSNVASVSPIPAGSKKIDPNMKGTFLSF